MYYNNKKLALSFIWIVLGVVLIALSEIGKLDASLYSGLGGGLIAVGILQIIRQVRYRSNADYHEKVDLAYTDERNKYVRMKSWAYAGYASVMIQAVLVLVCTISGHSQTAQIFMYSICIIAASYAISCIVVNRRN